VRVAVAEDDVHVRQGVEGVVASAGDLTLVGSAGDLDAAMQVIESSHPDVVVTDIKMPPTMTDEGIRLAAEVERLYPGTGVVVLSQYDDPDYVLSCSVRHRVAPTSSRAGLRRRSSATRSAPSPRAGRCWIPKCRSARQAYVAPRRSTGSPRETEVLAAMAADSPTLRSRTSSASAFVRSKHINASS
jgi:DNA-binding NarL/FixJ family response regulator